jgi:hypothetical protein
MIVSEALEVSKRLVGKEKAAYVYVSRFKILNRETSICRLLTLFPYKMK